MEFMKRQPNVTSRNENIITNIKMYQMYLRAGQTLQKICKFEYITIQQKLSKLKHKEKIYNKWRQ